jgi:hypothetical protein
VRIENHWLAVSALGSGYLGAGWLLLVQPPLLPIGARWRQPRLDGIVADEILILRLVALCNVNRISHIRNSFAIKLLADGLSLWFIDDAHSAVESGVHWPVVRELQGCAVI